jgi:catechol 2,3-dioxygenase-like lactoylglutathione lyase family enzyme
MAMQVKLTSVVVNDQEKALAFYTERLGFEKKLHIPIHGAGFDWITLVSPEAPDGPQIALEPMGMEFARTYYQALYDNNVPCAAFATADLDAEYERLKANGVEFTAPPKRAHGFYAAVFKDTVGNLIQIYEG